MPYISDAQTPLCCSFLCLLGPMGPAGPVGPAGDCSTACSGLTAQIAALTSQLTALSAQVAALRVPTQKQWISVSRSAGGANCGTAGSGTKTVVFTRTHFSPPAISNDPAPVSNPAITYNSNTGVFTVNRKGMSHEFVVSSRLQSILFGSALFCIGLYCIGLVLTRCIVSVCCLLSTRSLVDGRFVHWI